MFKRSNFIAFLPFIVGMVIYSLITWKNATVPKNLSIPSQTATSPIAQPAKKVKLHLIDFDIHFATGKHEEDIEKWDKTGCELDFNAFQQNFDNDFSHVYAPKTYEKYDVRGKFTLDNVVYYFDSQGLLNQAFNGFNHVNKPQLHKLWKDTCFKK